MVNSFIVKPKATERKEDKSVVMSLRLDRTLQEAFDSLAGKSGRSRNELMCMALRFALDQMEELK